MGANVVSNHAKLKNEHVDHPKTEPNIQTLPPTISLTNNRQDIFLTSALILRRIFYKQEEPFRLIGRFIRKICFVVASRSVALSRRSITISLTKVRRTTLISCAIAMI